MTRRQEHSPRRPARLQALTATIVGAWIRSGWRGSTRGPTALARYLPLFRALPVTLADDQYIYVDLRDGLSHRLLGGSPWTQPPWEEDEQRIMRALVRDGDVVFDIGAHIGLHTVLLSSLVGPGGLVHAFEINPRKIPALRETIRRLANVTLHTFGLADCAATRTLYVPEDQSMASLANWTAGRVGPVERLTGRVETIDTLLEKNGVPAPDFVKCDVEGAETMIFRGGAAAFDRDDAPIVLYEADARSTAAFGSNIADATRVLRGFTRAAYAVYWVQPGGLQPIDLPSPPVEHFNLVAVPASRRHRLASLEVAR